MPARVRITAVATKKQYGKAAETFQKNIAKYFRTTGKKLVVDELNKTVKGWTNQPVFKGTITFQYNRSHINLNVKPTGKGTTNWIRVNDGTGPRILTSRKGLMSFQRYYKPKTTAQGQYGGPGTKFGPWVNKKRSVGPHTIEPRDFTGKVVDKVEARFLVDVDRIKRQSF